MVLRLSCLCYFDYLFVGFEAFAAAVVVVVVVEGVEVVAVVVAAVAVADAVAGAVAVEVASYLSQKLPCLQFVVVAVAELVVCLKMQCPVDVAAVVVGFVGWIGH